MQIIAEYEGYQLSLDDAAVWLDTEAPDLETQGHDGLIIGGCRKDLGTAEADLIDAAGTLLKLAAILTAAAGRKFEKRGAVTGG